MCTNTTELHVTKKYYICCPSSVLLGWFFLERHSDCARGWVPMSTARELESSHVRARNFKQRHAFLKLLSSSSSSFIMDAADAESASGGDNSNNIA